MDTLAAPARFVAAALALLVALHAPTTLAQTPQPSVTLTLDGSLDLGAANTTTLEGTVAYADTAPALAGATDGTVTLTVTAPEGWTIEVEPASAFTLAPGGSAPFTLTITAPPLDPGAPDATGEATLTASAASADGRSAEANAPLALTALAPPAPPPVPWYQTPLGMSGIALAVLAVLALAAYAARRRKQRLAAEAAARDAAAHAAWLARETGISLDVIDGPREYGHRREVIYRLDVANTSDRPRVALVEVADITNGWRASTSVARLPLSAGEKQTVTLCVTPDAVITPGDRASVVVRAKPEEAKEKDERVTLEVVAPKSGVPTDPHYRIVTVHREGANKPIQR